MNWIERFRQDDNAALKELYLDYKDECLNWCYQKFGIENEAAIELFQSSVIIVYDNVQQGKLTELTSSIKTYLFAICRNKALEYKRRLQKLSPEEAIPTLEMHVNESEEHDIYEQKLEVMSKALDILGDPCKKLLQLYYYQQQKMTEITEALGYKNADTAKNQKYKCMKRLQKLVAEHKDVN